MIKEDNMSQNLQGNEGENPFQSNLNPAYTFENLIKSSSNKFAYEVAEMTAHNLGDRKNNPLIIYSAPGLGKTRLLHAIGNEILRANLLARVLYISSEEFFKEYVQALQNKETDNFREKFSALDVLLMDDIQFFSNKPATLLQFAYTIRVLIEQGRQVVLSLDKSPLKLGWNEKISALLVSGVIAEIEDTKLRC